jgi:hypothetical protein
MIKLEVENGKFYIVVSIGEGVSVAKEISREDANKLMQQLKSGLINTEPAGA